MNTLVLLPGESHGQRSLEGYSLWGTERLSTNILQAMCGLYFPPFPRSHFQINFSELDLLFLPFFCVTGGSASVFSSFL